MKLIKALLFLLLFPCILDPVVAASCRKTGSVCVDTTPSKNVSGVNVTLAQVGGCWDFKDTYECIQPNAVDYCAAISKIAGCWQTGTSCISAAWDGTCLTEQRTFRCGDPSLPTPSNTVKLGNTYTITKDQLDTSQCTSYSDNPPHLCGRPRNTCYKRSSCL